MAWAGLPSTTYRPMPADFPEKFVQFGWEAVCEEMRAHKDTVRRWMLDYGEEELQQRRRAYLEAKYAERGHRVPGRKPGRAGRYVMGRALTALIVTKVEG